MCDQDCHGSATPKSWLIATIPGLLAEELERRRQTVAHVLVLNEDHVALTNGSIEADGLCQGIRSEPKAGSRPFDSAIPDRPF